MAPLTDYRMNEPNASLTLYEGPIALMRGSDNVSANGIIELRWLPDTRVVFALIDPPCESVLALNTWVGKEPMLSIPGAEQSVAALVTHLQGSTTLGSRLEGIVNGRLGVGCPDRLARMECYLPNLADFRLSGPDNSLFLRTCQWEVQIRAVEDVHRAIKAVERTGGYVLTHRATIFQSDGATFTASESELVRESLSGFFSFVQGRKANAILPLGYTADGYTSWWEWCSWWIAPWKSVPSWADPQETSYLHEAYAGFMSLWQNEAWREVLGTAIHWYAEANANVSGLDAGIVFTQMALELLAWHYFVEHRNSMTKEGFNRLTAADRIRMLLAQHDIPLGIAATLPGLSRWARELNQTDAADAITVARNIVVHPEVKLRDRFRAATDNLKHDAWTCGLWMLEMVLLRLFGYSGHYIDRREPRRPSVVVPWSKQWREL